MFARLLQLFAAAIFLVQSGLGAVANSAADPQLSADLVVEHADVLLSPSSGEPLLKGYLVVWNGTGQSARITDVRSSAFRKVEFIQTVKTRAETRTEVQAGLFIPAHSELLMRPGGVYLSIDPGEKSPRVGEQVTLEILFADGGSETVAAQVSAAGSVLEDHHHGMPPAQRL